MQYRNLGRSGLKISPICLGTMMFGGPTDEATSTRIVAKAREAGVNFIDTADAYNNGNSETVVGRAISNNRQGWILATKLANQIGDDPNRGGLSRRWVLQAADESLKRLGTDYIDIYYLHKEDHSTPLEETVRAMGELMQKGKVRYFGVSNYRAWRVAEICNICDRLGIDRPVASQPYYNAMNRMPEVEHFPACAYYGLGIVPYSPLARGVLTGKYRPDAAPGRDTRAGRNDKRMMQTEWRPESLKLAQEIKQHAEAKGITAGQFAVSWVLNSSFVSAVIAGPRTEEQWDDYTSDIQKHFESKNLKVTRLNLSWSDEFKLTGDAIVAAPGGAQQVAECRASTNQERTEVVSSCQVFSQDFRFRKRECATVKSFFDICAKSLDENDGECIPADVGYHYLRWGPSGVSAIKQRHHLPDDVFDDLCKKVCYEEMPAQQALKQFCRRPVPASTVDSVGREGFNALADHYLKRPKP